nr:PREDICTED: proton-coupled folate transporter-like [Latimeria chalumnae]|eukprot:XP_005989789.2 PREDICTED: proton-coupled folate transporter-like [Latimeria chalumnae]
MILPCVSAAISGGLLIAITNVEDMNAYWTILAAAISGISGGYTAVFLSAFSYIADVTDRKSRTKRMGIAESMIFVGGTVGFLLSGLLLQHYSFTNAFGVYCGLNVVSVLYILLWIVEPKCCPDQQNLHHRTDDDKTEEIIKVSLLTYAKQSLKTILKQRPAQDRQKLLFSLVCMFLINLCNVGEQSISLMYLMYPPRSFTSGLYGGFNSTKMLLSGFCLLCVFPLLLRCIRELTLAKFGTIVRAASFILLAFSTNTWMVFIVAVVGAPSGFTVAVIRSVSSQIVEPTEQDPSIVVPIAVVTSADEGRANELHTSLLLNLANKVVQLKAIKFYWVFSPSFQGQLTPASMIKIHRLPSQHQEQHVDQTTQCQDAKPQGKGSNRYPIYLANTPMKAEQKLEDCVKGY